MRRPPSNSKSKSKRPARKPGRPTLRTDAIIKEICERLSTGEPLAQICRDDHLPKARTIYDWLDDADVSARFERAREVGAHAIAAEALRIADTPQIGTITTVEGGTVSVRTEDMLGHRKLQVDTRLRLLAKWHPKQYGDRVALAGDADAPLTVQVLRLTDAGD